LGASQESLVLTARENTNDLELPIGQSASSFDRMGDHNERQIQHETAIGKRVGGYETK
jgi:hypothetical protein